MKEAVAFAPCHITGLFQIFDQSADALHVGSTGAGVSLNLGAKTVVKIRKDSKSSVRVRINNHTADAAQVSKHVVEAFLWRFKEMSNCKITVEHQIATPIGAGFGTSGAAALSLSLALNEAFDLGMTKIEAAQHAHTAEVECGTGLGTVIAETFGGLEIRIKPGAPGIGEIKCLPVPENTMVACLAFGPLSTRRFLSDKATRARINESGGKLIAELVEKPNIVNFMGLSRQFADQVGLTTEKVRTVLDAMDQAGIVCSMPMFGESVFTVTGEEDIEPILRVFHESGPSGQTFVSKVDVEGARLLQ
jgi:pantoate kinase